MQNQEGFAISGVWPVPVLVAIGILLCPLVAFLLCIIIVMIVITMCVDC